MDDWENEDAPVARPVAALASSLWADEDKDDGGNVKESWDADDDEESSPKAPAAAKAKPAAKTTAAPKKGGAAVKVSAEAVPVETELQKKLRLQKAVETSDLTNAADLFGDVVDAALTAGKAIGATALLLLATLPNASTVTEFNKLAQAVAEKLLVYENKVEYIGFLEKLCRDLLVNQRSEDVRKIASILNILANERQKEEKLKAGGAIKKKTVSGKKVSLKADVRGDTFDDLDDGDDHVAASQGDYDDFM